MRLPRSCVSVIILFQAASKKSLHVPCRFYDVFSPQPWVYLNVTRCARFLPRSNVPQPSLLAPKVHVRYNTTDHTVFQQVCPAMQLVVGGTALLEPLLQDLSRDRVLYTQEPCHLARVLGVVANAFGSGVLETHNQIGRFGSRPACNPAYLPQTRVHNWSAAYY